MKISWKYHIKPLTQWWISCRHLKYFIDKNISFLIQIPAKFIPIGSVWRHIRFNILNFEIMVLHNKIKYKLVINALDDHWATTRFNEILMLAKPTADHQTTRKVTKQRYELYVFLWSYSHKWDEDTTVAYCWPLAMHTVYPKKYAHGFVVLCFVVVMQSFIMNSHEVFIHIHQGCFAGTGALVRLPQCQWSKPDGYGKISQCMTTTKHSKAKTVCIFLGIYCRKTNIL